MDPTVPAIEGTSLRVGDVLDGKYRIDRVLGRGGMGLVLAASHLVLRQRVAIKLLLPEMLSNEMVVARFEREARAAAQLRSDHVARVVDVGFGAAIGPYMVMEFLEGSDLEDAGGGGALSPNDAVNYVLQACEALAEAHRLGIIHRDLKPQNLFLTRRLDGSPLVKVLDFGISKMTSDGEDHALTRTRDVMGSPLYMSPEQMRGTRDVDTRTDIWALGAILYRLTTGRPPFDGENVPQLCARVMMEEPTPVRELRPDVPDGLANVIERCLRKDPAARYPGIAELANALDPFASHQSLRAAERVLLAAGPSAPEPERPPATASVPPSARTNPTSSKRSAGGFFIGLAASVIMGGAGVAWTRLRPVKRHVAATAVAEPTIAVTVPSASASVEATMDAGSAMSNDLSATPPPSPARPVRAGPKKVPGRKPAPTKEPSDDAPELRK